MVMASIERILQQCDDILCQPFRRDIVFFLEVPQDVVQSAATVDAFPEGGAGFVQT
ncbi:MAG: hypothetical protein U0361_05825 [Nitrospiraceae bacterium]